MLLKSVRDLCNVELKKIVFLCLFGICSFMNDEFWIFICDFLDWILIYCKKWLWEYVRLWKVVCVFLVRELNKLFIVFISCLLYFFLLEFGLVMVLLINMIFVYILFVIVFDKLRFIKYLWFFVVVMCK